MTNIEKIKRMNSEELANFLSIHESPCEMCIFNKDKNDCLAYGCVEGIIDWLEQRAKE